MLLQILMIKESCNLIWRNCISAYNLIFFLKLIFLFWLIFNLAIWSRPAKDSTGKFNKVWTRLETSGHTEQKVVLSHATFFPWWLPPSKYYSLLIYFFLRNWWPKKRILQSDWTRAFRPITCGRYVIFAGSDDQRKGWTLNFLHIM